MFPLLSSMNRLINQQCLAKAITDQKYVMFQHKCFCRGDDKTHTRTNTGTHTHGQCQIPHLAWFTEPLPGNIFFLVSCPKNSQWTSTFSQPRPFVMNAWCLQSQSFWNVPKHWGQNAFLVWEWKLPKDSSANHKSSNYLPHQQLR